MDRLKSLYAKLTTRQKNAYKGYLGLFYKGEPADDKQIQYLHMIDKDPTIDPHKAAERLYGDSKSKAFLMLRFRLYERLTEFLSSSLNTGLGKYDKELPYSHDLMQYRRQMLNAQVLFTMGLNELGVQHLRQARGLARNCCTTELETDALLRLRGNFRTNAEDYQEIEEALQAAQKASISDVQAIGVYHGYLNENINRSGRGQEKLDYLQQHLPKLEETLTENPSIRAGYYLNMLRIQLALLTNNYDLGKKNAMEAIRLLDEHKGMRTQQRRAEPYMQLGNLGLRFGHFEEAASHLRSAQGFFESESLPFFSATTGLIYACILGGDYDVARTEMKRLEALKAFPQFQEKHSIMGVHDYLNACIDFKEGKANSAWQKLQPIRQLYADKEGWGTGLRIFEIVVLVEMKEFDWAESRVESLRKHVGKHDVSDRDLASFKLLRHASRHFFEEEPIDEARERLEILESYEWNPLAHEVIRVDEWYRQRIETR